MMEMASDILELNLHLLLHLEKTMFDKCRNVP